MEPENKVLRFCAAVLLFTSASPCAPGQTRAQATEARLPTVSEIFEKFLAATGGRDAWLRLTSIHMRFDVAVSGPISMAGTMEFFEKAPDKISECMRIDPVFLSCQSYDGDSGWSDDSNDGLSTLQGEKLAKLKEEADFYSELHRASNYTDLVVKGEDVFDGLPVYVVAGTRKDGRRQEMYFSKESGLEAGSKVIGPNDSETKINHEGDYKEVAKVGFKIATRLLIVTDQTNTGPADRGRS